MISVTPPAIPGFEFTKLPYADLLARFLAIPGYTPELLGQSVNGRQIYGFFMGDPSKPTMYLQSNIHGNHEWRTCWWMSEFMKLLNDPSPLPAETQAALVDLRARYSFYFIPSVNPNGYGTPEANGRYGNANGVSVSENFDYNWAAGSHVPGPEYRGPSPWSEPESQIVRDKVLQLNPVSLLCTHSWGGHNGWTTRVPQNSVDAAWIVDMLAKTNAAIGFDDSYEKKYSPKLVSGSAYNWAGTLVSSADRTIIGQVWESGDLMTPVGQSRVGMTGVLYHMLMVDSMLPNPDVPIVPPLPVAEVTTWGPIRVDGVDCPVASVQTMGGGGLVTAWEAT